MKRKIIPYLLALTLLFTAFPFQASAAVTAEGKAGGDTYWKLYSDGQMYVSGKGELRPQFSSLFSDNQGYWAKYADKIKSVIIVDGITSIGEGIFSYCNNLKKVSIADSVTEIGKSAFFRSENLEHVTLSNNLNTIGKSAFSGTALSSVSIPESVTVIGEYAFGGTKITEVTIPAGVTELGNGVFSNCTELKTATFLNNLSWLPEKTFSNCESLEEVHFTGGISNFIDSRAFQNCVSLKTFSTPVGTTSIGEYAFSGCTALESVFLPDTITSIGSFAFEKSGLTELTIPDSVTRIWTGIVSSCDKLVSITFPSSAITDYLNYFGGGESLQYAHITGDRPEKIKNYFNAKNENFVIYYDTGSSGWDGHSWGDYVILPWGHTNEIITGNCGDAVTWSLQNGILTISGTGPIESHLLDSPWEVLDNRIHTIIIEPGVTSIGDSAFYRLENLQQVTIANTVETIGAFAFEDCTGLTEIVLPEGVKEIKSYAFRNCNQLKQFIMSNTVITVNGDTFTDCSSLETVHLSDALTSIPQGIFTNCYNLGNFNIPKAATAIGHNAFSGCSRLTEFNVPEHITAIGSNAFRGTGITEFFIPPWVEDITTSVFDECRYLDTIHFQGNPPEYPDFRDMTLTIYYPANNEAWKDFVFEDYGGTITWIACETVHDLQESTIPATCTEPGSISRGCACGYGLSSEELPALGHSFENKVCIRCGLEESALLGDVDGNGTLNYSDALMILRASIGLEVLERPQLADVNGDGESDYSDALTVLRRSIGLE